MINRLICTDCIQWLAHTTEEIRMIFADPPDSIGLKYNGFKDKFTPEEYRSLLWNVLHLSAKAANVLWISVNTRHVPLLGHLTYEFLQNHPEWEFKPCVQTFTFGQHNHNDFGNNHRLLYRYLRTGTQLYPDAVRVESERQKMGDKRADPRGRVPGDVFDFPRVTGNSKQKRKFSPTQLNEGLYERCIKMCCARGDLVVDLFGGSGTLGRVAERCGVDSLMLETSRETCDSILLDQPDCEEVEW
jgi:DNA modification methylase